MPDVFSQSGVFDLGRIDAGERVELHVSAVVVSPLADATPLLHGSPPLPGALDAHEAPRTLVLGPANLSFRRLDQIPRAVIDTFKAVTKRPELMLEFTLQPGEAYFINNYTILHSRTGFEDFPEPERRRHMIRLWLTFRERRLLADGFAAHEGYGRNHVHEVALQSADAA